MKQQKFFYLLIIFHLCFYAQYTNAQNHRKVSQTHAYIDLGLPSGTKWATCNIGANAPEEFGDYFAWGETEPKAVYNWETYKWCNGTQNSMTKYCTNPSYGPVDGKSVLENQDDAAYVNWGPDWRMPTWEEQNELREQCDWEWTILNNICGMKVKSRTNANYIFLPAAGYRSNSDVVNYGNTGYYQSASLDAEVSDDSYYFYINKNGHFWQDFSIYVGRDVGFSVRPVCANPLAENSNHVENGDFSLGNLGFESDYEYVDNTGDRTLYDEGKYAVGTSPRHYHVGFIDHGDHTTGSGNMLIANGSPNNRDYVWRKTFDVEKDVSYEFSAWFMSVSANSPMDKSWLEFDIDGTANRGRYDLEENGWTRYYWQYTAKETKPIEIKIRSMSTVLDGNDFALDDISFSPTGLINSINFAEGHVKMVVGEKYRSYGEILPNNAKNQKLTWISSKPEVATVDEQGVVTALSEGSTKILATATDGSNKKAYYVVEVVPSDDFVPVRKITLKPTDERNIFCIGETRQLTVDITPANASNQGIFWKSFDPEIATVDQNGLVTAVSEGTAEIMAVVGKKTASIDLIVSPYYTGGDVSELLIYRSYRNQHLFQPVKGVTADGQSCIFIALKDRAGAVDNVLPTLKAFDNQGQELQIPEDEIGTIELLEQYRGRYGFVYHAPGNINNKALGNNKSYDIKAYFTVKLPNGNFEERELATIKLYRPALLLTHGLMSSAEECYSYLHQYLMRKKYWPYDFVDYKDSHTAAFDYNAIELNVVGTKIQAMFEELYKFHILSTAYDLCGHSMGGILSRFYAQRDNNYQYVHKLITFNSPMWGSKVANLAWFLGAGEIEGYFDVMKKYVHAFTDLSCYSQGIADLSLTANKLKGKVPVHAMCSYILDQDYDEGSWSKPKYASYDNNNDIIQPQALAGSVAEMSVIMNLNSAEDGKNFHHFVTKAYGEDKWDVFVGFTSQKAGLEEPYISVFPATKGRANTGWKENYSGTIFEKPAMLIADYLKISESKAHHCNVLGWEKYCDCFYNLICAPVNDSRFSYGGFKEITEEYKQIGISYNEEYEFWSKSSNAKSSAEENNNSKINMDANWNITEDAVLIDINVACSNDIVGNMVLAELEEETGLYASMRNEYHFSLPLNYSGIIKFHAIGKTANNRIITDSITVDIPEMIELSRIRFNNSFGSMVIGQQAGFTTIGFWEDGTSRSVNAELSTDNTDVAIIQDGMVKALKKGKFILTAEYNGQTASMDIEVLEAATEEGSSDGVLGDVNSDDVVDQADVEYIKEVYLGRKAANNRCDVDCDGKVSVADVTIVIAIANGTYDGGDNPQPDSHEYVDLGLSVKWATMNVGANSPEDHGGYYAWGEIEEKDYYDWSTYKWSTGGPEQLTKYCTKSYCGPVDGKATLELDDDVAHVKWGSNWRIPTIEEQDELRTQCTWTWTERNGVSGYQVIGPNGNSIFLPLTGMCDENYIYSLNYRAHYWSSSVNEGSPYCGMFLDFGNSWVSSSWLHRSYGLTIRPVYVDETIDSGLAPVPKTEVPSGQPMTTYSSTIQTMRK